MTRAQLAMTQAQLVEVAQRAAPMVTWSLVGDDVTALRLAHTAAGPVPVAAIAVGMVGEGEAAAILAVRPRPGVVHDDVLVLEFVHAGLIYAWPAIVSPRLSSAEAVLDAIRAMLPALDLAAASYQRSGGDA